MTHLLSSSCALARADEHDQFLQAARTETHRRVYSQIQDIDDKANSPEHARGLKNDGDASRFQFKSG